MPTWSNGYDAALRKLRSGFDSLCGRALGTVHDLGRDQLLAATEPKPSWDVETSPQSPYAGY